MEASIQGVSVGVSERIIQHGTGQRVGLGFTPG